LLANHIAAASRATQEKVTIDFRNMAWAPSEVSRIWFVVDVSDQPAATASGSDIEQRTARKITYFTSGC
jgi:hypothetical protein